MCFFFFFQAEDGIRDLVRSRGLGDVYKRQVWDDHEIANDAYVDGAENHSPDSEGAWTARKAAALQAYHEWMPIRTGSDSSRIYRSFDFGNLVSLHMLDTRLAGRERQVGITEPVSYTHLRAHETVLDLVFRLLLEKKNKHTTSSSSIHTE